MRGVLTEKVQIHVKQNMVCIPSPRTAPSIKFSTELGGVRGGNRNILLRAPSSIGAPHYVADLVTRDPSSKCTAGGFFVEIFPFLFLFLFLFLFRVRRAFNPLPFPWSDFIPGTDRTTLRKLLLETINLVLGRSEGLLELVDLFDKIFVSVQ